jgi:glycosyltransferase involved in cell wall biosynthesis
MKVTATAEPRISVVIPTYNRCGLLSGCLDSLAAQSLDSADFEVVVVDDGSDDATAEVCAIRRDRLPLRYHRMRHAGTSAAKNAGLFLAVSPIALFFDDDDVAAPDLLAEHLAGHRTRPDESVAVLGHTAWRPGLAISHLMRYVTEVDGLLYAYGDLADGAVLDFRYFWCGRTSFKRTLLARRALFRSEFDQGLEDIELARRLVPAGLRVVYRASARQYMARPVSFDGFLARCEGQGRSRRTLASMYADDAVIQDYCAVRGLVGGGHDVAARFDERIRAVHALETWLGSAWDPSHPAEVVSTLYRLYGWCFRAAFVRGGAGLPAAPSPRPAMVGPLRPRPAAAPRRRP